MEIRIKKPNAFTLIELLVVIAIIAVLISVIVPSLKKARDLAKRVICANNLKQQHLACMVYCDDYKGMFPTSDANYYAWGGKAGNGYGAPGSSPITVEDRLLNPYVGRLGKVSNDDENVLKVFYCPADNGCDRGDLYPEKKPTLWDVVGSSYHYVCCALDNDFEQGLKGKKIPEVRSPSAVILVGDCPVISYYHCKNPKQTFQKYYWHNRVELGWTNVLFVDGGSRYMQMTTDQPDFQNGPGWTVIAVKKR